MEMIEVHVSPQAPGTSEIERTLTELVVAHRVVTAEADGVPVELPAVFENGRWYGAGELDRYLADLRSTVGLWRKYQSDACYVEDDGSIC